jgi:UDP-N-acetyl-alpha-D-muramoyl-L-alanyl-L-glutamate epimerase
MKSAMSEAPVEKVRAELFRYLSLEIDESTLLATYELDGRRFSESVTYDDILLEGNPAVIALARLWFLLAGLSYYKAGAAQQIDLGAMPLGPKGRALLKAALREGLGEFAYKNSLSLEDVEIVGGIEMTGVDGHFDPLRVLVPFGGGIDSVVTTSELSPELDQALFVVSPPQGRFAPLEATAECTGLDIVRATRSLDPQILSPDPTFFRGHFPVTAMVTLLAAIAAAATGRGGVVMSNEHSSSVANLRWNELEVNHQWSKSYDAEILIGEAIKESVGSGLVVASYLRDRSEVWVAEVFSHLTKYHHVFRSCNRAFSQDAQNRLENWCGECDKCLFINLMLAPYLPRAALREIFHHEPLSDPARNEQLRVLVGAGASFKPFECVGDPDESAVALTKVTELEEWRDVERLDALAQEVSPDRSFDELLESQGPSRVPAHWIR